MRVIRTCERSVSAGRGRAAGAVAALLLALAVIAAGCGGTRTEAAQSPPPNGLPQGAEAVRLDPANFTTHVTNPYWPLAPGSTWVYADREAGGAHDRDVLRVLKRTKVVDGVTALVVRDRATHGSRLVEDTFDWFAQDKQGNVWYLGEATKAYSSSGTSSSTAGSWEAGVAGAQPGVVMPAHPAPGLQYRQEYRKGTAQDQARVLSVDDMVQAPAGRFRNAVLTKEFSPLEPDDLEYKLYAKGVGLVRAIGVSGDLSTEALVRYRKGGG